MSAEKWIIAGIILAAVLGTAVIILRFRFNQDRARWARDRWPIVHPGESDSEQDDHGVGDDLGQVLGRQFHDLDAELDELLGGGEGHG